MLHAAIYDVTTGAICRLVDAPDNLMDAQLESGEAWLEVPDNVLDTTHYVNDGAVTEKTPLTTTHAVSGLEVTFDALPSELTIEVEGQRVISDGTADTIGFELPGTYTLELRGSVPHLDETLEVTVG